jgi:hypothetical protein
MPTAPAHSPPAQRVSAIGVSRSRGLHADVARDCDTRYAALQTGLTASAVSTMPFPRGWEPPTFPRVSWRARVSTAKFWNFR